MRSQRLTGRCLCGSVSFEAAGPIVAARQCWCRVCQSLSCGSGSNNIIVQSKDIRTSGQLSEYRSIADSGSRMVRSFCPTCGTPVFSASEGRPDLMVIRTGTLDNPEIAAPEAVIWTSSAPSWACIDKTIPSFSVQPASLPNTEPGVSE
ncbi:GFA family protein [Bosea sp. (in: a-proteobacteria)]|uniref:GFA family protein n=1 Tax=Bosea sp. (in: a-proteobacteria) TaxID=1871050 RepID=UPI003A5CB803